MSAVVQWGFGRSTADLPVMWRSGMMPLLRFSCPPDFSPPELLTGTRDAEDAWRGCCGALADIGQALATMVDGFNALLHFDDETESYLSKVNEARQAAGAAGLGKIEGGGK